MASGLTLWVTRRGTIAVERESALARPKWATKRKTRARPNCDAGRLATGWCFSRAGCTSRMRRAVHRVSLLTDPIVSMSFVKLPCPCAHVISTAVSTSSCVGVDTVCDHASPVLGIVEGLATAAASSVHKRVVWRGSKVRVNVKVSFNLCARLYCAVLAVPSSADDSDAQKLAGSGVVTS